MTTEEAGFLITLKQNPDDATARSAYADWLDEHDRPYEALLKHFFSVIRPGYRRSGSSSGGSRTGCSRMDAQPVGTPRFAGRVRERCGAGSMICAVT
jgi:uncharacterized protein (TIGR02996 family)